jgi:hypothetical protein
MRRRATVLGAIAMGPGFAAMGPAAPEAEAQIRPDSASVPSAQKIYDIACADGRRISNDRCDGDVGNTVDEANATYLNNIGDAELRAVWTDPDFDAAHGAVYYVRVLEIPTPTWQAYDANYFGIEMPPQVPLSHQERACTSPIWYSPGG